MLRLGVFAASLATSDADGGAGDAGVTVIEGVWPNANVDEAAFGNDCVPVDALTTDGDEARLAPEAKAKGAGAGAAAFASSGAFRILSCV